MLKKKNIAMTMAVATVATTVAPAFAATLDGTTVNVTDETKMAELKAEIKGYLDVKYTNKAKLLNDGVEAGECVYTITVDGNPIESLDDLDVELARLSKDRPVLTITVEDKGHKVVDGEMVNWKEDKFSKADLEDLLATSNEFVEDTTKIDDNTVSLKLQNNDEELVIKTGDVKLNLEDEGTEIYLKDSVGSYLDKDGEVTTDPEEYVVIGFAKKRADLTPADEKDTDFEEDREFTVRYEDAISAEFKATDLYDFKNNRFETIGNELAKYIVAYNEDDVTIEIENNTLVVKFPVEKEITTYAVGEDYAKVVIKGSTAQLTRLAKVLEAITSVDVDGIDAEAPEIEVLAGTDRYKTAVEVAKTMDSFNDVVLVSGNSIADGLAATPFAASIDAPVLLTGTDKISDETMELIEGISGKVYLIGGENSISKKVETQLRAAGFEADAIERIAGDDRFETSLKIAEEMGDAETVFVAGGYAQADAMSIAAVAARENAPMLLVDNNGLNKSQAKFLKETDAFIVGGKASVSEDVEKEIAEVTDSTKRIAGADRQETNAKVIKEFYTQTEEVTLFETIYVAKSDDKSLVDALPAGVVAGLNGAPIVLATNELNSAQESVLKTLSVDADGEKREVTKKQVGYGIASKVWESLNKIFKVEA